MSATVDRIRKLLTLAENPAASENEAEIASRMAAQMMEATGVTREEVFGTRDNFDEILASVGRESGPLAEWTWQKIAAMASAYLTGATYYRENPSKKSIFVGTSQQREASITLYTWLLDQIETLAKGIRKRTKPTPTQKFLNSYRLGVAEAVCQEARRLNDTWRKKQEVEVGDAMIRIDAVDLAIKNALPALRGDKRGVNGSGAGFYAGLADGRSIELQRKMGAPASKKLTAG